MKKGFNQIIDFLITIVMVCLLFTNGNILVKYTKIFQTILFALIGCTFLIKKKINFNGVIALWIFMALDLIASYIYSIDPSNTKYMLLTIMLSFIILFFEHDDKFVKRLLNIIQNVILIGSISIIISVFIPRLIIDYFSFFVTNSPERILEEINSNHYSGLFSEKGNAAFLIDIGIGIIISKYFSKNISKKDYVQLVIFFIALLLTNKRALTALAGINILAMFIISNEKNKALKILKISCISIICLIVLFNVSPIFKNIFDRFINDDDNGRNVFKEYCIDMFEENNLIGTGFNTFNTYIYNAGFRVYDLASAEDGIWRYHAHNVYYQILGETGVIGFALFIICLIIPLYKTGIYIYKNKNFPNRDIIYALYFSFFVQLLFIMYSYTGNTIYYMQQITIYFIALCISFNMKKRLKRESGGNE